VRTLWGKQYKDKAPIVHLFTKEPDEFDLLERDQSAISQIGDEFDSFIDGNPVLLGEREISLSWWLEEVQRRTYPNLSRFAIDILSMPTMSAESERGLALWQAYDGLNSKVLRTWKLAIASYLTKT
jgi:hAT family protein